MKKAYVLMTALPPTMGHLQLVQFASLLASKVIVLFCTQPEEPLALERLTSFKESLANSGLKEVEVIHYHKSIQQDPAAHGFRHMWHRLLKKFGVTNQDCIVASEKYGQWVAEMMGAKFYPYDIDRKLNDIRATWIRENPLNYFSQIIPEFRPYLRTTVTVFGAESTGKTTLSYQLAKSLNGLWLYEYARPYLENTINEITVDSMTAIWKGQSALQKHANNLTSSPFVIQDTDLFSTVGYWQFPHWKSAIGECPKELREDAIKLKSDLYIFTKSNIPFEKDPLRYGGDKREGSDEYWLKICKENDLLVLVLDENDPAARLNRSVEYVLKLATKKASKIYYNRKGL